MKLRTVLGSILLMMLCQCSHGQERKTLDLFLGYSYTRVNPSSSPGLGSYPLQGGEASISYKVYRWVTAVADFGLGTTPSRNSNIVGIQIHGTQTSYLFGPRAALPHWKRVTPFGQVLLGFSHATRGLYDTSNSQKSFAWTAGGGLDFRLNGSVSLRPIQVEYLQTRFSETTTGWQYQNNMRASIGVVLHF
jgi:opacity protein-like surface antigen